MIALHSLVIWKVLTNFWQQQSYPRKGFYTHNYLKKGNGVLHYARQIITFSLTNHDVTIENHTNHLETFLDQRSPQMVLVLTLGLTTKRIISRIPKIYFSKHTWIFWFETNKGHNVTDDLNQNFSDVTGIDFDSRFYVASVDDVNQVPISPTTYEQLFHAKSYTRFLKCWYKCWGCNLCSR